MVFIFRVKWRQSCLTKVLHGLFFIWNRKPLLMWRKIPAGCLMHLLRLLCVAVVVGIVWFYFCIILYLYGDIAIYAVAMPESLRDVVWYVFLLNYNLHICYWPLRIVGTHQVGIATRESLYQFLSCHVILSFFAKQLLHTCTQPFYGPFWDHRGELVPEEIFWTFMVQRKITEADTPTTWHDMT